MALDKNLATIYPLFPVLFLGMVAATDEVAHLRIALSYIAIPALLLAPISRLLMVKLPDVHARTPERLRAFFVSGERIGCLILAGLTLPFVIGAPWLITALYGEGYAASIPLTFVLAIDSALLGFGLTAGPLFRTLDRTDLTHPRPFACPCYWAAAIVRAHSQCRRHGRGRSLRRPHAGCPGCHERALLAAADTSASDNQHSSSTPSSVPGPTEDL